MSWEAAVRAHAAHYLAVAEEATPRYCGGEQVDALGRVDAEHPNLTAAVERSLALGESGDAGRLCWALWMYWWLRGHHALGARLSEAVLAHGVPPEGRAHTSLAAATMRFAMDDVPAALGWWEQAVAHAVDPTALANGIAGTGLAALATGDLVTARARFAEARVPAEEAGDEGEWTWALSLVWSGTVDLLEGDFDAAVAHIERGLASARRRGDRLTSYIALYNLSQVELARGRRGEARRHLEEGMRLSLETGDHSNLAYLLDATAVLEAAEGTLGPGAAAAGRGPGDPRGGGVAGLRLLPARPGCRARPPPTRRAATSVPTATTTRSTPGAAWRPRRPPGWCWGGCRPRAPPRPDADPYTSRTLAAVGGGPRQPLARVGSPAANLAAPAPEGTLTTTASTAGSTGTTASDVHPRRTPPGRRWALLGLGAGRRRDRVGRRQRHDRRGLREGRRGRRRRHHRPALGAGAADPHLPRRDHGLGAAAHRVRGRPAA